ncbi:MAG: DUF2905 domain-containing protein [Clostridiales bacterium]|nr:DUF2905 domain-containing protein [Clostridiales bacterium]
MDSLARLLFLSGLLLIGAALLVWLFQRVPGLGHLPGDILIRRGNVTVYIPLATSLLLSLILTIFLNLWFFRR